MENRAKTAAELAAIAQIAEGMGLMKVAINTDDESGEVNGVLLASDMPTLRAFAKAIVEDDPTSTPNADEQFTSLRRLFGEE